MRVRLALILLLAVVAPTPAVAQAPMTWAVHISLAPTWFDPGEHTGVITIMKVLYAIHDAMVKPMPGNAVAPSLAESWTVAKDRLSYEFVLRRGVVFHNGDPLTAEDVKFTFERYRGAGWVVPKKYVEKVGDDGFKKAPVGAGPPTSSPRSSRVWSWFSTPTIATGARHPTVKRLVWRVVPEGLTRLAMLTRCEVDVDAGVRPLAPQPSGGQVRALTQDAELGPHHALFDQLRAREGTEATVDAGQDTRAVADRGHRGGDPVCHHLGVLDHVGGGVDDPGQEEHALGQRVAAERFQLVLVPRARQRH
jgi:hypothetical protein